MKKIKLYGVGNVGTFNFYIFDKKKEVHKILNKLFWDVFKIEWMEMSGDELDEKKPHFNIERNSDFFQYIGAKPIIGVFYGKKRMFIVLLCSDVLRLKLNRRLEKIAIMPKLVR